MAGGGPHPLSSIPSVESLMSDGDLLGAAGDRPRSLLLSCVRAVLEEHRAEILSGSAEHIPSRPELIREIGERLAREARPSLRRVVNATGVIIHTNIGRAPLAPSAVEAVRLAAERYTNLEIDLDTGERSRREEHYASALARLTGAEAALAVNNNAAAVLLCLTALAKGREVIVSRGELIEIGGSFRLPDVMDQSGARLVEVGTTNKTRRADYADAIRPETALLMKAHPSNYRIEGFTAQVAIEDLVALGAERGIPVLFDAGSGALQDLEAEGLGPEPVIGRAVQAGVDLVTFSGDKLFGGPQAGLIAGRRDLVERVRRHPLHRALRMDKLAIAALSATLREHLDAEGARSRLPVSRMLFASTESLRERAEALAHALSATAGDAASVDVVAGESEAGGGSLPGVRLATTLVRVRPSGVSAARAEEALRRGEPSVLCRIREDALLFDPRTLLADDDAVLAARLPEALR